MTGLVFLHGWGYGPQTWDSLVAAFSPAPVIVLDAGYFGPPRLLLSGILPGTLPNIFPGTSPDNATGGSPGIAPGGSPGNAEGGLSNNPEHTSTITCTYNFPDNAADSLSTGLATGLATGLTSSLPETLKDIIAVNPGGWLGVGHSLGFARLLALGLPWRGLVGLGGFLRFCSKPGQPTGTPTDLLDAMISRLDTAPQDVLARFHKRCGHIVTPLPTSPAADLARLRADLELLRNLDLATPKRPVPTLLIQAQDDRIVPPNLAREAHACLSEPAPGSRLELLASGGHALPMTRPQDCQRLIREFVDDHG